MWFQVDPRAPEPPSEQLAEQVRLEVAAGRLGPGDQLPSVRQVAAAARVNPNTVSRAWRELEFEGTVEGRSGTGVFVTPAAPTSCREWARETLGERLARCVRAALSAGMREVDIETKVRETARAQDTKRNAG